MEDALKILDDGTVEKVFADKLHEYDKTDSFICPDCSTYVDLRMGQEMKYFAHRRNEVKRLNRENCPRYCEGNYILTTYHELLNITGFTLLLADLKKLTIILPKIYEYDVGKTFKEVKKIRIFSSAGQAFVDIEDLQYTDVPCELNFYGNEYLCEFMDSRGKAISDKESSYLRKTIGLDKESGVLFHDNKNDHCKRILPGSQIIVGKSYLYLTPYNLQNIPRDIECWRLGDISLCDSITSSTRWRITRIKATNLNIDTSKYFRTRLGLELVYDESCLDFIWPPSQIDCTNIRTTSKSSCLLAYHNYDKGFERVYQIENTYRNRNELYLKRLSETFSLLETSAFGNKAFLQIRGRTTPSILEIVKDQQLLVNSPNNLGEALLQFDSGEILNQKENKLIDKSVFFVGRTSPNLLHIQNGVIKKVHKRKIDQLHPTDKLILDNKAWGIFEYIFSAKKAEPNFNNFEKRIEEILAAKVSSPDEYIQMPIWVKEMLFLVKNSDKIDKFTCITLLAWLRNNEIPLSTLPLFKGLYTNYGVKRNV